MAALPFIFLTSDLHVVYSTTLQQGQPPATVQLVKYFFKSHVDNITQEFFDAKAVGSPAAEEWLKGLDDRGGRKRNDASRWERWGSTGGVKSMRKAEPAEALEIVRRPKNTPVTIATTQLDTLKLAPLSLPSRIQNNFSNQPAPNVVPFCKLL
jgi:hypothetical protein